MYKKILMLHLTTNKISSFLDNKLSTREKQNVIEHLLECDRCYHDVLDLYFLLNDKPTSNVLELNSQIKETALSFGVRKEGLRPKKNFFGKPAFIFSFASVLLAVTALVIFIIIPGKEVKQFREYDDGNYLRITSPQEEAVLDRKKIFFEWSNMINALSYRFIIYNETGDVLLDTTINNNSLNLTSKLRFESNTKYFWDVKAVYSNGQTITSKLNVFTIE